MSAGVVHAPRSGLFGSLKCPLRTPRPLFSPQRSRNSRSRQSSSSNVYQPRPYAEPSVQGPRWSQTPAQYSAPYRSKPPVAKNDFYVNNDPDKLDEVYSRILGANGHTLLSEETKWLAVTHKSFDHGKRGYNERLTVLGAPSTNQSLTSRRMKTDAFHYRQDYSASAGRARDLALPAKFSTEEAATAENVRRIRSRSIRTPVAGRD